MTITDERIHDIAVAYPAAFREEADRAERPAQAAEYDAFRRAVRAIEPVARRFGLLRKTVVARYASWIDEDQDVDLPTGETLGLPSLWISVDDQEFDAATGQYREGPLRVTAQYDGFDPHFSIPVDDASDLADQLAAVLEKGAPEAVVADRSRWQAFLIDSNRVITDPAAEAIGDGAEVCVARGSAAPLPNDYVIRTDELECDVLYRKPLAGMPAEARLAQAQAVAEALNTAGAPREYAERAAS